MSSAHASIIEEVSCQFDPYLIFFFLNTKTFSQIASRILAKIDSVSRIGFVGLGVMGGPMAGHLASIHSNLMVWNRSEEKAEPFRLAGIEVAPKLVNLSAACDVIFTCLSRTEDVMECLDAMSSTAKPGTLFVDHSTILPEGAKKIHEKLTDQGFEFLDAPITGGSMGAKNGQLTIFCGGTRENFERAAPLMAPYTKRAELVGGPGAGQTMKVANQIAVGGALLALCESIAYAKKAGLNVSQCHQLLSGGAAGSWAFDNYGPKILNEDWSPGFSITNQVKDFGYALKSASEIDASLPGTELVNRLLSVLESRGEGQKTTAALYETILESGFDSWK